MPTAPPLYRWDIAQPRALIHIVHGMSEHAARYARLAAALNGAGYAVWGHDHRGHGKNVGPQGLGHFADADGWRALIDDAWAVSSALQAQHPRLPLVLFAHSMGSFAGQALIAEHGAAYRAVVLSGSNGPPEAQEAIVRAVAYVQRAALGGRRPGTWVHRLVMGDYNRRFAPNRTSCDWLSRDAAEVDRYIADPLCGQPLSAQSWIDFLAGRKVLCSPELLARIPKTLPILLIAGALDPVGGNGRGVRRLLDAYQAAGLAHVRLKLYEGARHELTNELNRAEVTADLLAWLDEVVVPAAEVLS